MEVGAIGISAGIPVLLNPDKLFAGCADACADNSAVSRPLVLSLFPGIGLLDRAFEEEGFSVVRGPDILWGGDIRSFHVPAGRFDGVIGGPPCQAFSPMGNVNRSRWGNGSVAPDMIPEFRRVVVEAEPAWWVMENSPYAYGPFDSCHSFLLDTSWLDERQSRRRRFWSSLSLHIDMPALVGPEAGSERTVTGGNGSADWKGSRSREEPRTLASMLALQGAPADLFEHTPFTQQAARKMVGNGVPLPMGRSVAKAVKKAMGYE